MTLHRRVSELERRSPVPVTRKTVEEQQREARVMFDAIFGDEGSQVYDRDPEPAPDFGPQRTPAERQAAARRLLGWVFGEDGGDAR